MKMFKNYYWILCLCLLTLSACKDFIEQDISNERIHINTPPNNLQSQVYNQLFWFDEVDGALEYRIQIVSPKFDSIVTITADTTITTTKYYKSLSPGTYQWRIWAENGSYKTKYQTYNLKILPAAFNQNPVALASPANGTYQQTASFTLTWDPVYSAKEYIVQVDTLDGNFVTPLEDYTTTDAYYSFSFDNEGDYKWRVRAKDSSDVLSPWSTVYYTGWYETPPGVPVPTAPANVPQGNPVMFKWNAVDRGYRYNLYVYKDDTSSVQPTVYVVNGTSKTISFSSSGQTIFWKVSATDKAGNEGSLSSPFRRFDTQ